MSDDGSGLTVRQSPRKRGDDVHVADLTVMVQVPGHPGAVRVYTDDQQDEAARYAAECGGDVVRLPLSSPTGYTRGPSGSLIPVASTERKDEAAEEPSTAIAT